MKNMSSTNWDYVEGVVDVGPIVISHCENPAKEAMTSFLGDVLSGKIPALIPVTAFLGAYHILTRYLKIRREDALLALEETLNIDSPAFYEGITRTEVKNALKIASINNIESWDGFLINLARSFNTRVIYTIDQRLERKGFKVILPISQEVLKQYHEWVAEITRKPAEPPTNDATTS